jgi:hypothetical protein
MRERAAAVRATMSKSSGVNTSGFSTMAWRFRLSASSTSAACEAGGAQMSTKSSRRSDAAKVIDGYTGTS